MQDQDFPAFWRRRTSRRPGINQGEQKKEKNEPEWRYENGHESPPQQKTIDERIVRLINA
jgi:hypothetical protein